MENIQAVIEAANRKVDGILEMEAKAQARANHLKWNGREALPETIRELLDEFVRVTQITPSKRELAMWLMEGQEWVSAGLLPCDIKDANEHAHIKGFLVVSPMSLTKTAKALAAQRRMVGKDASKVAEKTQQLLKEIDGRNSRAVPQPPDLYLQTKRRLAAIEIKKKGSDGNHAE